MILAIIGFSSTKVVCQYRVLPGDVDADGLPTTPARICLGPSGTEHCYVPPNYMKDAPFGLDPKAQDIGKLDGKYLTLFTSTFSGGGSGNLTNFALLAVRNGDLVNILPKVQLTNQSEYKIWNLPQISNSPVIATADFVWNFAQETHFAHHQYTIEVFVFNVGTGHYVQRLKYTTTRKYPGLDDAASIRVLDAEKQTLLSKLKQSQPS